MPDPARRPPPPAPGSPAAAPAFLVGLLGLLSAGTLAASSPLLAPRAAVADVAVILQNGQRIEGNVPAGETLRFTFDLAKGCAPNLRVTLYGGTKLRPISFQETVLYGPDNLPVDVPSTAFYQRHVAGADTIGMKGFAVPATGRYVLTVQTNATVDATARGTFKVKRPTSVPFSGDETTPDVLVDLQFGDGSSVSVKRVNGTAPRVARYRSPSLVDFTPGQKLTGKGSVSNVLGALEDGTYRYTIGYQSPGTPAGAFKGVLRVTPVKTSGTGTFLLVNPPNVPLTVRNVDRYLAVPFGGTQCAVAVDGVNALVTSESSGKVLGKLYNLDLEDVTQAAPTELASDPDLPPGQAVSGHRVIWVNDAYFLGFSSVTGTSLALVKLNPSLTRNAFLSIVDGAPSITRDFFLVSDGTSVSVGRARGTDGHTVHIVDAATHVQQGTVDIGGGALTHSRGAGAAWNPDDSVYELFAPDTVIFGQPSDIHRYGFDASWVARTGDTEPISDPLLAETFPTAVSYDQQSDIVIVHYVVPENGVTGAGRIHRRLFRRNGTELPDSHVILQGTDRHRPTSVIFGNSLFLASDGPTGPIVERYRLLR